LASNNPPTKQNMARAVTPSLPPELLHRPKSGFQVPLREWLMEQSRNSKAEGKNRPVLERGLRGWARNVCREFAEHS
jgi:asparagine synthase (glutamine-hydrolysing)